MNLAVLLARAGRVFPDAPALALGERVVADYRGLAGACARLGAAMRARLRLAPGDRIALFMSNCPAYVELTWAAWWAGLALVPINAKLHAKEAEYILDHSGARVCFVDADHAQAISALAGTAPGLERTISVDSDEYRALAGELELDLAEAAPDDLAWLFYTSGTTGRPKGVMLTHRNLLAMTLCYFTDVDAIGHGDSIVHAAPMSHGSGIYGPPHVATAALQVIPESGGFEPAEIFSLAHAWPGMAMFAAPTMVKRLVDHARAARPALDGLKTVVYGGGPMYLADIRTRLRSWVSASCRSMARARAR